MGPYIFTFAFISLTCLLIFLSCHPYIFFNVSFFISFGAINAAVIIKYYVHARIITEYWLQLTLVSQTIWQQWRCQVGAHWGTLPLKLEVVPHQCRCTCKLLVPEVPLLNTDWALTLHKGLEIEQGIIAIFVHRISRSHRKIAVLLH